MGACKFIVTQVVLSPIIKVVKGLEDVTFTIIAILSLAQCAIYSTLLFRYVIVSATRSVHPILEVFNFRSQNMLCSRNICGCF